MINLKSQNSILGIIALAIVSVGSFLLFGIIGLRTILGTIILFLLPSYMIFDSFNFTGEEKAFFSFFAAIAIIPSLVYWIGFVIPFRISIFAVFVLLLAVGYIIKKSIKKPAIS